MTVGPRWRLLSIGLAAALFLVMALVHAQRVNTDPDRHDQDSYLAYAARLKESGFTAIGTRRQMPIYPTLQAVFYEPDASASAHFTRAKRVNIALSFGLSILLVWALARLLPRAEATNLALVAIFFVIAFRAPYVQAEVLVYALVFLQFLAMCRMWRAPTLPLALAVGGLTALGWLVKGTALLGLYVFLAALAVREGVRAFRFGARAPRAAFGNAALGAVSFAAFFAGVYPYAKTSKAIYGAYLYDMSTRYVMWCDSWEQYCELNRRFGTHDIWKDHPPPEIPTMRSFFATHSLGDIALRTLGGLGEVVGNCLVSHGYALFFVLLLGFATALVVKNRDLRAKVLRVRDPAWAGWFVVPYLVLHLLVLGFYAPLGAGDRFSLAMFLPATYAAMRAVAPHANASHVVSLGKARLDWAGFQSLFFALVVVQIVFYFPAAMATFYSGG
jgi:hypothetical protein